MIDVIRDIIISLLFGASVVAYCILGLSWIMQQYREREFLESLEDYYYNHD